MAMLLRITWEKLETQFLGEIRKSERQLMLQWTILFLAIALIAGVLGFAGIAGAAAGIAKILFVIFLVLFLVSVISRTKA